MSSILEEEKAYAEKIEEDLARKEKTKNIFNRLSLIFSAITLASVSFIFNRFRRDPEIFQDMDSLSPDLISPAEVGVFMGHAINTRSLLASLFDLASREYITIEELERKDNNKSKKKRGFFKGKKEKKEFIFRRTTNSTQDLIDHEEYFINWIFSLSGEEGVTTLDIYEYRKNHPIKFSKWLSQWSKLVNESLKSKDYYDTSRKKHSIYMWILYFVILALGIFSVVNSAFYGILLFILSIGLLVYSIVLFNRRSDKGHIQYLLWKDFKDDLSIFEERDININQDRSLIYAIALGVPMKELNDYRVARSPDYYPRYWGHWYFLLNKKGGSLMEDRIGYSFYGSHGSSTSTTTSFGGGGGFSGGGGGGAGGGGAGGF